MRYCEQVGFKLATDLSENKEINLTIYTQSEKAC